jgi:hypothetical protein
LANANGSGLSNADTGLASIAVTSAAELKYGRYMIKAMSGTTVDVYAMTDADFARGTDLSFVDDTLKITSSALTITTASAIAIPSLGVSMTGGSGTIGFTSGQTAMFEIKPPSSRDFVVKIGTKTDLYPEFACYLVSQPLGNGEKFSIDVFRVKGIGLPMNMEMDAFSEAEIKCEAFYDSTEDAVCQIRSLTPA